MRLTISRSSKLATKALTTQDDSNQKQKTPSEWFNEVNMAIFLIVDEVFYE